MKVSYDRSIDAVYIYLVSEVVPGQAATTYACDPSEVGGHINLDFDSEGRLIGIEVLDASTKLPAELLRTAAK